MPYLLQNQFITPLLSVAPFMLCWRRNAVSCDLDERRILWSVILYGAFVYVARHAALKGNVSPIGR